MSDKLFSIWLIGPTAASKTTIAQIMYKKLKNKYPNLVLLDGDELRGLYDNKLGYDLDSRSQNMQRYIRLAKWVLKYRICLIGAINGAIESDRKLSRKEIFNYQEIYLNCSLEERMKRDKKKLYERALKGEIKNVLDVDLTFETPKNCDLEFNTENQKPEIIADAIISHNKLYTK